MGGWRRLLTYARACILGKFHQPGQPGQTVATAGRFRASPQTAKPPDLTRIFTRIGAFPGSPPRHPPPDGPMPSSPATRPRRAVSRSLRHPALTPLRNSSWWIGFRSSLPDTRPRSGTMNRLGPSHATGGEPRSFLARARGPNHRPARGRPGFTPIHAVQPRFHQPPPRLGPICVHAKSRQDGTVRHRQPSSAMDAPQVGRFCAPSWSRLPGARACRAPRKGRARSHRRGG